MQSSWEGPVPASSRLGRTGTAKDQTLCAPHHQFQSLVLQQCPRNSRTHSPPDMEPGDQDRRPHALASRPRVFQQISTCNPVDPGNPMQSLIRSNPSAIVEHTTKYKADINTNQPFTTHRSSYDAEDSTSPGSQSNHKPQRPSTTQPSQHTQHTIITILPIPLQSLIPLQSPRNSSTRPPGYIELGEAGGRSRRAIAPGLHRFPGLYWDCSPHAIGAEQTGTRKTTAIATNSAVTSERRAARRIPPECEDCSLKAPVPQ